MIRAGLILNSIVCDVEAGNYQNVEVTQIDRILQKISKLDLVYLRGSSVLVTIQYTNPITKIAAIR